MAASLLQHATGFAAGGAASLDATLAAPATAGNALVFAVGGDKDLGTITLTGFSQAVYTHTANVSLLLAWMTAAGGETTISATYTSGNAGGSNLWVAEVQDTASALAWELKASAVSADSGATVTTKTSGTSGTIAAGGGLSMAGFAVDSVNTSPSPSYTNSYTGVRSMGNGGNEAGLWVATLSVSAGDTTETTIDRDPLVTGTVTADQMAGGLIVLGRTAPPAAPVPASIPYQRRALLVR